MTSGKADPLDQRIEMLSTTLAMVDRWGETVSVLNDSIDIDSAIDKMAELFGVSRETAILVFDNSIRIFTPWFRLRIESELSHLKANREPSGT